LGGMSVGSEGQGGRSWPCRRPC